MSTTTARTGRTRAQRRSRDIKTLRIARSLTQLFFAGFILVAGVRHQTEEAAGAASVDALCPFGAVETLITWLTTGTFITKIHQSNMVLGVAVLVAAILVGNTFCGWICPFGAVQDALSWVRRKLHLPTVTLPRRLDQVLRWGRHAVLVVVIYMSVTTGTLWFAGYDPYVTMFSLHWLFAFTAEMWPALLIMGVIIVGALVVDRFWCRYLCPLGAVFHLLGPLSLMRIRRQPATCTDCTLCDKPCPVGIEPSKAKPFVSTDCIGCMDCVAACPVKGALNLNAPVLLGIPVTKDAAPVSRVKVGAGIKEER